MGTEMRAEGLSARNGPRARSRRSGASGQATAEFGLVMIVVLGLFLAIVDVGHIVAMHAAAVTSSREAARYGAATGVVEAGDGTGVTPPANTKRYQFCEGIRLAARKVTGALITLPSDRIDIAYDNGVSPTPAGVGSCGDGASDLASGTIVTHNRVVVRVELQYAPISPLRYFGNVTVESVNRRTIAMGTAP
jgi:Flp pilus assembly protein TadG